ncbi:P-loop containing nucleoside triphosphate hydrolase protein [Karstenula rhodostoma CBS 690.94]|uniref:ATP-dependent RNA helicase ROK1 n=1 Tax=Karstenula rhodostoma CBS 690.94 TaxID=1392251 RepID=A0A9P4UFW9_9PLEO|nr:P-loop containing nucleoside triphosphate hydrolase protein [Karstenula rhodostoma CBS 690.94]
MNVFKLLSRSSKAAQTTPAQKLPSSGAVANPQLFGHDEPTATSPETKKSNKRKRGKNIEDTSVPLPADLDFFGSSKKDDMEPTAQAAEKKRKRASQTQTDAEVTGAHEEQETEPYNADESKRILRLHKLKVTVLEDFAPQEDEAQSEKSKKKRKKEKKVVEKKKDSKKQLFPQPLTSFAQLRSRYGISRRLAENLNEQAYTLPTEVQLGALPLLLRSRKAGEDQQNGDSIASGAEYRGDIDLLSVAPTGSGKTIAFLIPIIDALLSEKAAEGEGEDGPRAIVIAPTRELASQIVNEARKLSKGTGLKATLMKKGMEVVERPEVEDVIDEVEVPDHSEQEEESASDSGDEGKAVQQKKRKRRRADKSKAAILVTTPAALLNALKQDDGAVAELPSVRHVVLDEADVLLDPLFREQTLSVWNACVNPLLRVGLWSATMGSNIEALAISTLNARWTTLSTSKTPLPSRRPLVRLVIGLKDTAIPNIAHQLTYAATEQGKLLGLRQLLHPTALPTNSSGPPLRPPFLVFTQTIPRAIALHSELLYDIPPEAGGSSRIAVLHADLSGTARESIMTKFRRGDIWVLITTDLLARGVDFRGLNGVVNYDVPNSAAAYVHRVGRTGRAGRAGGVAVTLYTQDDIPYVKLIANVIRAAEKLRGVPEEEQSVKQWLLDALPTPTKREKQELKKKGVEARRNVKTEDGKNTARISTKSGYERRVDNRKRGAVKGSKQRAGQEPRKVEDASESEFEGFE